MGIVSIYFHIIHKRRKFFLLFVYMGENTQFYVNLLAFLQAKSYNIPIIIVCSL